SILRPPSSTLCPYTTLFRSRLGRRRAVVVPEHVRVLEELTGGNHLLEVLARDEVVVDAVAFPFPRRPRRERAGQHQVRHGRHQRSEEHTSELQSRENLVCRL